MIRLEWPFQIGLLFARVPLGRHEFTSDSLAEHGLSKLLGDTLVPSDAGTRFLNYVCADFWGRLLIRFANY
jgi:hypothetical protein